MPALTRLPAPMATASTSTTVISEPAPASCTRLAADPDDPDGAAGQVAAAAVAAVATVNAPAAIRATALDRLH